MRNLIQFTHALADETRWRLLQLVCDDALCVCELADILKMPHSSVSSHLQVIRKAGLLESERREKWIYYQVAKKHCSLLSVLRDHFEPSPTCDKKLAADAKRAKKRLQQRAKSCCPAPQKLATPVLKSLTKTKNKK